jgi:hypothetical protein
MVNVVIDTVALLEEFHTAKQIVAQHARWSATDAVPVNTCRYCGRYWQHRFGSRLDGHAACIVTEDFKRRVGEVLRSSPTVTYRSLAKTLGVTPGIVNSWAFSAGIAGPVTHSLRKKTS